LRGDLLLALLHNRNHRTTTSDRRPVLRFLTLRAPTPIGNYSFPRNLLSSFHQGTSKAPNKAQSPTGEAFPSHSFSTRTFLQDSLSLAVGGRGSVPDPTLPRLDIPAAFPIRRHFFPFPYSSFLTVRTLFSSPPPVTHPHWRSHLDPING